MFKRPRRQMKHVEIISGEWLLLEGVTGSVGSQELADVIARYVRKLMSRLHISAPQLEKVTFATKIPDQYGARITQDLALDAVSSILPNVNEISIIRRVDPVKELGLENWRITRKTLLTFRKNKVNGDWENLFGPDPRRLRQLERANGHIQWT